MMGGDIGRDRPHRCWRAHGRGRPLLAKAAGCAPAHIPREVAQLILSFASGPFGCICFPHLLLSSPSLHQQHCRVLLSDRRSNSAAGRLVDDDAELSGSWPLLGPRSSGQADEPRDPRSRHIQGAVAIPEGIAGHARVRDAADAPTTAGAPCGSPRATSGAMKPSVPHLLQGDGASGGKWQAKPKSHRAMFHAPSNKRFAGLTSRCTTQ